MIDRKEFIRTCGFACLSLVGLSAVVSACAPTKHIQAELKENKLRIAKVDFFKENDTTRKARHYVIVKTDSLSHPIVVYRFSDSEYSALLLQCTHQQMELNVSGDLISCSAHGSEFNNKGEVSQGPAESPLKRYKISSDPEHIYIHLS